MARPWQLAGSLIPVGLCLLSSDSGATDSRGYVIHKIRALCLSSEQLKAFHKPTSVILSTPPGSQEKYGLICGARGRYPDLRTVCGARMSLRPVCSKGHVLEGELWNHQKGTSSGSVTAGSNCWNSQTNKIPQKTTHLNSCQPEACSHFHMCSAHLGTSCVKTHKVFKVINSALQEKLGETEKN